MGDPVPLGTDRLREMFQKAEGQIARDNYRERPRKTWRKVTCPECGYKIEYIPTRMWRGLLKCPDCGARFKPPSLDGFVGGRSQNE